MIVSWWMLQILSLTCYCSHLLSTQISVWYHLDNNFILSTVSSVIWSIFGPNEPQKGNGCGSGVRVVVGSYELMLMLLFPLGWGSCKLRQQQLLRLLKCLVYTDAYGTSGLLLLLLLPFVVAGIVVAVVISMPAHTHTHTAGSLWRAHTTIGHAVAVACARLRFRFPHPRLLPLPCSGNFSWCEKVYLMANCRLPASLP